MPNAVEHHDGTTANKPAISKSVDNTNQKVVINRFLPQVESLRGLAAFAVLVEHSYLYTTGPAVGLFANQTDSYAILHWLIHIIFNGRASVVLFFVISGFVLGRQLASMQGKPIAILSSYIVRRIFRIMPAMWVAVFIAYLVFLYLRHAPGTNMGLLFENLFFWNISLDIPLWSLGVEMGCSLIFPLLYLLHKYLSAKLSVALVAPMAALIFLPPWSGTSALRFLVLFQIGLLVGNLGPVVVKAIGRSWQMPLFIAMFAVYAISPQLWPFENQYFNFYNDHYYLLLEIPACFYILSYVVSDNSRFLRGILTSKLALFLGRISFSLYVLHYILTDYLWPVYGQSPYFTFLWEHQFLFQTVFFFIVTSITIPVATLIHKFIEVPFNKIGKRIGGLLLN